MAVGKTPESEQVADAIPIDLENSSGLSKSIAILLAPTATSALIVARVPSFP